MNTYVFTDLHGRYNLWKQIQDSLQPNDKAICLGDCIDRGPDGIKILQEIFLDKRITLLLGNHEDLLLYYIEKGKDNFTLQDKKDILYNGTEKTLKDFFSLTKEKQEEMIQWLQTRSYYYLYHNSKYNKDFFLSHAGGDPQVLERMKVEELNFSLLWDRTHLKTKHWDKEKFPNLYIIHGHSPIRYLASLSKYFYDKIKSDHILYYCDGHKIDLDMLFSEKSQAALFNLDTLKEKYLFEKS